MLAPVLRRLAVSRRFRDSAKEPIEAYVERVSDVAQTVKWEVDGSYVEISPGVSRKASSLSDFPRGHSLGSARIVKS